MHIFVHTLQKMSRIVGILSTGKDENMLDSAGRSLKDRLLGPVVAWLPRYVRPTHITVASLIPGVAAAVLAAGGHWVPGLLLFWLNRLLDGLDGLAARTRKEQTDLGGYIDIMADFAVYAMLPVGVWWGAATGEKGLPLALLLATFYVNGASWMYLSALLEKRRASVASGPTSITMPTGLVEGTETIIFFTLFFVMPHRWEVLFLLMAGLTALGIVQRLIWAVRVLGNSRPG
jgi:phosphatidylglycerophosphate synthase